MRRLRLVLAGTLLLVLVALAVPAVGLAGGSAGDQQYTDPFAGGSGSASPTATTTTASPATTTASPATTTASPATTTASPAPAPSTTGGAPSTTPAASAGAADPTTAAADPASTGQPTATIAGGSATSLPYTGYDAWTAVGFGLTLVAGGAFLRWRLRSH